MGGKKPRSTSYGFNPPKQRISIHLTPTSGDEYSPEDPIKILESMKPVEQQKVARNWGSANGKQIVFSRTLL
jgi:hypothetical protein